MSSNSTGNRTRSDRINLIQAKHSLDVRWLDGGTDDAGVYRQDRNDDARQEKRRKLVDVFDADENEYGHKREKN